MSDVPTVRFYYNSHRPLDLAGELLAKLHAARPHGRTLVRLPDAGTLDTLDRLLWTQHDFLPHVPLDAPHAAHTPICLTAQPDRPLPEGFDATLNLTPLPHPPPRLRAPTPHHRNHPRPRNRPHPRPPTLARLPASRMPPQALRRPHQERPMSTDRTDDPSALPQDDHQLHESADRLIHRADALLQRRTGLFTPRRSATPASTAPTTPVSTTPVSTAPATPPANDTHPATPANDVQQPIQPPAPTPEPAPAAAEPPTIPAAEPLHTGYTTYRPLIAPAPTLASYHNAIPTLTDLVEDSTADPLAPLPLPDAPSPFPTPSAPAPAPAQLTLAEHLIGIEAEITRELDRWLATELPEILQKEFTAFAADLRTRISAHARATLAATLSERIAARLLDAERPQQ